MEAWDSWVKRATQTIKHFCEVPIAQVKVVHATLYHGYTPHCTCCFCQEASTKGDCRRVLVAPGREAVSKDILGKIYQWCSKDCHLLWQLWLSSAPPVRRRVVTRWGHLHPHGIMLSPSTPFLAPNNFGHVLLNGICLWESRMPAKSREKPFTYFSQNQYTSKWCFVMLILAVTALWEPN